MVADQRLRGAHVLGQMGDTQFSVASSSTMRQRSGSPSARARSTGNASEPADAAGSAAMVAIQIKID